MKIHNVTRKVVKERNQESVVYQIPCSGCDRKYIEETGRGLHTRVREHRYDMRTGNVSNAIVTHALDTSHLPSWDLATILHQGMDKTTRKALEAAQISNEKTINSKIGSSMWAPQVARRIIQDWPSKVHGRLLV